MDTKDKFEAMTGITDFLVASAAFPCLIYIIKHRKESQAPTSALIAFFFGIFGIWACIAGGAHHLGLRAYRDLPYYCLIWPSVAVSASIGLAAHALAAQFEPAAPFARLPILRGIFCFMIVGCAGTSIVVSQVYHGMFYYTLLWQLGAMAIHLLTYLWIAVVSPSRRKQALALIFGDLLYLVAGVLQTTKIIRFDAVFMDHNSVYHLVQLPASFFLMLGYSPLEKSHKKRD